MILISKRNSLLLALLLLLGLNVTSQIIISSSDMPSPGDIIITSTGLNINFVDYEDTGENYIWDFSQLIPLSQAVDTFIGITDVPFLVALYFGDKSNLVKKDNNTIPIPGFPITKQYTFLNNTSSSYNNAGVLYTISQIPIPLKYNSPDILYSFPMEYGNTSSSFAEYAFGADNFGFISKEITRTNTVDGWGTLTTPYGTFEVLRLKSDVVELDSIYIDSLGMGAPLYREYTEYSWLGKDYKIPLLKITSSFGGAVVTYLDSLRFPSAINDKLTSFGNDVKVFPNPTTDFVNITLESFSSSAIIVDIFDVYENMVANKILYGHKLGKVDVKMNMRQLGLKNGMYFLKITSDNQQVVKRIILL